MTPLYCRHCGGRCLVFRVLDNGWSGPMSTCPPGMESDRALLGADHTTARNPHHPSQLPPHPDTGPRVVHDADLGVVAIDRPNDDGHVLFVAGIGYGRDDLPPLIAFVQAAYRAAATTATDTNGHDHR